MINKWAKAQRISPTVDVEFDVNKEANSVIDYQHEELSVALIVDKDLSQADAYCTEKAA